jgi:hypothetical protein
MTSNKKSSFFNQILLLLTVAVIAFGCAVQQKPQGGPRDRLAPKLLKATPVNKTRKFSAKQIQLEFDEFFALTNQYQEINITPAQDKPPEYKVRQKNLIIELKDTLLKNTTYVINFGKSIHDVNEGNVLKNFTYVFSTGDHIDSLSISGTVVNTTTQLKEKDITVMLFDLKQDSLLFGKKKPGIYTTTDSSGNFTLSNLKADTYRIYALKETASDKIFNSDNELIAFSKKPLVLKKDTTGVQLSLFKPIPPKLRLTDHRFDSDGRMLFIFNKGLVKPSARIIYPAGLDEQKITEYSKTGDSVLIYSKNMDFDSIKVEFSDNKTPVDTSTLRKGRKDAFTRTVALSYNLTKGGVFLKPGTDLHFAANLPIASVEQSMITLNEDSAAVNFTLLKDTGNTKGYTIKYRWKQKAQYNLVFNEDALITIYGDKNKKLTKRFSIDKPENYSNLTLKVTLPDTGKAYVVELLNDNKNTVRSDAITKNTTLNYRGFPAAKYTIRVVYDDNRNGKWDSGSLKEKLQPENVWVNDKVLTLRQNWDAEEAITVPKEVITP